MKLQAILCYNTNSNMADLTCLEQQGSDHSLGHTK